MMPDADARLLEQIRSGDAAAGQQFVQEHYQAIYRYLLYLTGQPDLADDLTQETFVQGWRYLHTFQGRGSLRGWLLRIARREFLRLLQRRQAELGMEGLGDLAAQDATAWLESVELRQVIDRLPLEEREVMLLHYLEGYSSSQIALITGVPARSVRRRLEQARERLRQEMGEDDLAYLNEPSVPMRQWGWLPLDQMYALATRFTSARAADQRAPGQTTTKEDSMERREFLRQAAVGAAGLMLPETEKEVVDGRLTQKVTCAFKGTALSDLCEKLKSDTGIQVTAGPSVADEKVTLFCEKLPLREVMRQLSRPFGYTWLRSGTPGMYRYELVQDLRSQLLEEELRNRDQHASLLSLAREMERYRPYLDLSPDEALARSKTAPAGEKKLLEQLAGYGWGPIQMYFRLSPRDLTALRSGQKLQFSADPGPGEQPLPPDVARGVLQCFRDWRVIRLDDGFAFGPTDLVGPGGLPAAAVPEAKARVILTIDQSELGQLTFGDSSCVFSRGNRPKNILSYMGAGPSGVAQSPAAFEPENSSVNARFARDPALRSRVTVRPQPSCGVVSRPSPVASRDLQASGTDPRDARLMTDDSEKVTTADVLEALHQASGASLVADYYTRLYKPATVSAKDLSLFEALNQLADTMRLRWSKDADAGRAGGWLQFRSTTFYNDRLKEVPNRLLARWAASRRQHGALTLDDLVEIAQLSDPQLDASEMAEGARECLGLREWDLARNRGARRHLRYLVGFTPAQRRQAMSEAGLPFAKMSLSQQQQFLSLAFLSDAEPLQSLEELAGATLRVDYSLPGGFQWGDPGMFHSWVMWVVPVEPGPQGRRVLRPIIRERTREAALQALRRLDPLIREAAFQTVRESLNRQDQTARAASLEAQIFPTELRLTFIYIPSASNARRIRISSGEMTNYQLSW
jgi:RNA polymerase sigma-70 factor, ECF subfamily